MEENNATSATAPRVLIEDCAGKFGFRVRWEYTSEGTGFVVWQIVGRQPDGLKLALFHRDGSKDMDLTPDIMVATPYISGCVRRDGRVLMSGDAVFAGPVMFKRHIALQKHLWLRAHSLMGFDRTEVENAWVNA